MTNKRITELTALDGDDVANDDVLVIVDVSDTTMAASGTNKKITVAELVTDSALTGAFWPNSSTALTGSNLANGDKLAVVDVGSPDVAKYITADELAQGSQFSSRYVAKADDYVTLGPRDLTPVVGTPAVGVSTWWETMAFDASSAEVAVGRFLVPAHWTTFHVDLWWTNNGAGSGDVRWRWVRGSFADGSTMTTGGYGGVSAADYTAPAQNEIEVSRIATSVTIPTGRLINVWIERTADDAGDTLANDCGLLLVEFKKAS